MLGLSASMYRTGSTNRGRGPQQAGKYDKGLRRVHCLIHSSMEFNRRHVQKKAGMAACSMLEERQPSRVQNIQTFQNLVTLEVASTKNCEITPGLVVYVIATGPLS